ncbi:hypothetical protein VOLCADRAFT_98510 [Volvox carteri f. nagariensis]|uniref:FAD dependent oxidoreductase domain-containing protein n=1 Tax=Volvox carteri f. nagariensis TaxID=3068 RepID=D8UFJ0_VOLCA|nr:uncharacterized protein VOLCADRAFT_98510 [Volvox carteri f. nagariensis]EFJ41465.1 hypothetical protein VOLCADRAFT_98510 [Volvox carteri f. nagariensis]|eukprot:XP_002957410.1 hypothetical protein VOLCADRAFT_98510 [Volvox carteri f. nagariensis]
MASAAEARTGKTTPRIVICGGGIIGAATAYYLAEKGLAERVTVVERHEPACAASGPDVGSGPETLMVISAAADDIPPSDPHRRHRRHHRRHHLLGKAGGFLALDWNDSSPVGPLARLSYRLHEQLAGQLGAERIGYRTVHTLQVLGVERPPPGSSPSAPGRRRGAEALPDWVDGHVVGMSGPHLAVGEAPGVEMGDPSDTAQVHPHKLTTALLDSAVTRGSQLLRGCVEGLQLEGVEEEREGAEGMQRRSRVTGVIVDGQVIPADAVVIAMGPWSEVPQRGAAAPAAREQPYALYGLQIRISTLSSAGTSLARRTVEPEVYPRPDGTVYVCGEPQSLPVPPSAAQVTVEQPLIDNIRAVAASLATCLGQAAVEAQQACYLPCAPDSLPVIGPVPGCEGAYLATGHTCWGILNGPGTGLVLAEMITEGGAKSCPRPPHFGI